MWAHPLCWWFSPYGFDSNFLEIEFQHELEFQLTCDWLVENKLSIHLGKTEPILFDSKNAPKDKTSLKISCNGISIASKSSVKYLGVELDRHLSGEIANKVISTANARLKYLYRQSKFISTKSRKLIASALIQCHFDYVCCSWYFGLSKKNSIQTTNNSEQIY